MACINNNIIIIIIIIINNNNNNNNNNVGGVGSFVIAGRLHHTQNQIADGISNHITGYVTQNEISGYIFQSRNISVGMIRDYNHWSTWIWRAPCGLNLSVFRDLGLNRKKIAGLFSPSSSLKMAEQT